MSEENIQFLPFNAINEYMLADYRQEVIRAVLSRLNDVGAESRGTILAAYRNEVQLHGFRDSWKAPLPMKVRGAVSVFENNPEFTAAVLSAWAGLHPELRQQAHDLLQSRGWELLPTEADRAALPGFQLDWPEDNSFSELDEAFRAANPGSQASDNDINLMITWLGGKLPEAMRDEEEEEPPDEEER